MPKKLLFVIDNLGSGGAQNQMTLLAGLLNREGYSIEFFTYHNGDFFRHRLDELSIPIYKYEKKSKIGISTIRHLSKLIQRNTYDAVISFLQTPSFYTSVVKVFAKNKIPLLISERFISFEKKNSVRYYLKKFSHQQASFATANSNHERERLIEKGLTTSQKIKTIYNVVDLDHFKPSHETSLRKKLLCVASVSQYKNGMCVVEALYHLKKQGQLDLSVSWVGNKVYTIPERAEYIHLMEQKIIEYELTNNWNWIDPTQDIKDYYLDHDALVHASYREGLPNVVCESLACGLPVILSDILDHPILVDSEKNGFLFNHVKPEELANAILNFYKLNTAERQAMKTRCRNFAETHFSDLRFVSEYKEIIENIMSHA